MQKQHTILFVIALVVLVGLVYLFKNGYITENLAVGDPMSDDVYKIVTFFVRDSGDDTLIATLKEHNKPTEYATVTDWWNTVMNTYKISNGTNQVDMNTLEKLFTLVTNEHPAINTDIIEETVQKDFGSETNFVTAVNNVKNTGKKYDILILWWIDVDDEYSRITDGQTLNKTKLEDFIDKYKKRLQPPTTQTPTTQPPTQNSSLDTCNKNFDKSTKENNMLKNQVNTLRNQLKKSNTDLTKTRNQLKFCYQNQSQYVDLNVNRRYAQK